MSFANIFEKICPECKTVNDCTSLTKEEIIENGLSEGGAWYRCNKCGRIFSPTIDYPGDFEKSDKKVYRWELFKYENNLSFIYNLYNHSSNRKFFKKIIETAWKSCAKDYFNACRPCHRIPNINAYSILPSLPHVQDEEFSISCIKELFTTIDIEFDVKGDGYVDIRSFADLPTKRVQCLKTKDYYGEYFSGEGKDKPKIKIYLELIKRDFPNSWENITSVVIIHELSHALFDPYNYKQYQTLKKLKIEYTTKYGYVREESMANALTIKLIRATKDKKLIKNAEYLMTHQPVEYRYGLSLAYQPIDCAKWIKDKVNGGAKRAREQWMKNYELYSSHFPAPMRTNTESGIINFYTKIQDVEECKKNMRKVGAEESKISALFDSRDLSVDEFGKISIEGFSGYIELSPKSTALYLLMLRCGNSINSMDLSKHFDTLKQYYSKFSDKEDDKVDVTIHGLVNDDKSWALKDIEKAVIKYTNGADDTYNYLIQSRRCSDHSSEYYIPVACAGKVKIKMKLA